MVSEYATGITGGTGREKTEKSDRNRDVRAVGSGMKNGWKSTFGRTEIQKENGK